MPPPISSDSLLSSGMQRPSAWLTCPAYALKDDSARDHALAAAAAVIPLPIIPSPLLALRLSTGYWPDAQLRIDDLQQGFEHRVLVAARGGYGCSELAAAARRHSGPWPRLIGYSDLTVLHSVWWQKGRRDGIYGFLPGIAHGERARSSTRALLTGQIITSSATSAPLVQVLYPDPTATASTRTGPCFAACLRVLAGLVGTAQQPDLRGCILAVEDIDERPYQMDRDLWQLYEGGVLGGVIGLVFGAFTCPVAAGYQGPSALEIARKWGERLQIPTVFGLPFGHDPDPLSLPVGGAVTLVIAQHKWNLTALSTAL